MDVAFELETWNSEGMSVNDNDVANDLSSRWVPYLPSSSTNCLNV